MKTSLIKTLPIGLAAILPACKGTSKSESDLKSGPDSPEQKPNIVIILTDDQGWGDLSIHGNPHLQTPNIDKLAESSVQMTNFYVSPLSAPTRASMLTGRYFHRTGVAGVTDGKENMHGDEKTMAGYLKDAGYSTACFGKWHNGSHYPYHPNQKGFDEFIGFLIGHIGTYNNTPLLHNEKDIVGEGYISDFFTDKAINFIESNKKKPFFCYLAFNTPHSPVQVPEKYYQKYADMGLEDRLAGIYGMCENIDDNVGRVLNTLRETGELENTIVVYFSDNGPNGERFNGVLKGTKGSVHEGGVKVPCFISWPGKLKPSACEALAQHIDLLPSLLSLTGNTPGNWEKDINGIDLSAFIKGKEEPGNRLIFSRKPWENFDDHYHASVRNERFRLELYPEDTLLYDLQNDPGQKDDCSAEHPEVKKNLTSELLKWNSYLRDEYESASECQIGFPDQKVIRLPVQDANATGNIEWSCKYHNDAYMKNITSTEDSIIWPANVNADGTYKVMLQYACEEKNLGSEIKLEAKGSSLTATIDKAFHSELIPITDYGKRIESQNRTWDYLELGEISLEKGQQNIVLSVISIAQKEVALIKGIKLIKTKLNKN